MATYTYDPNGNLTGGDGWSLSYNAKKALMVTFATVH